MAPISFTCGGCRKKFSNCCDYLKCKACAKIYDLDCTDINVQRYRNSMSKDQKSQWICCECRSKQPKTSNINTPIRALHNIVSDSISQEVGIEPEIEHVTFRKSNSARVVSSPVSGSSRDLDSQESIISAISERVLAAIRTEVPSILTAIIQKELVPLQTELQEFRISLDFFNKKYEEVKTDVEVLKKDNYLLKQQNDNYEITIQELTNRISNTEQYLRENNLEFHGIPEHRGENLNNLMLQCSSVIASKITGSDIISCVRVAKQNKNSSQPRAIIAKFATVGCRDEFYSSVHRYNKANPTNKLNTSLLGLGGDRKPVFVSEHLSPTNKYLHAAARKKAKELKYQFVWVRHARIYVRKDAESSHILIRNVNSLDLIK